MKIEQNISLKKYNTFGIDVSAKYFCEVKTIEDVQTLISSDVFQTNSRLILGGGANILFTKEFDGLVIKPAIKGIEVVSETENEVLVKAFSGENWHDFVVNCCENRWNGLENLAHIPGTVGASPIQNIGAYGVEIKDVMDSLEAFNLETRQIEIFSNLDCRFDYRESVFKNEYKGKYMILSVTFRLSKNPKFNTDYVAISNELSHMGISDLSAKDIVTAIQNIRNSKFSDFSEMGTAGCFYKNPTVSNEVFQSLKNQYPNIVAYLANFGVKLSAGWLIEHAGWKSFRDGDAGVHSEHALVLVNYGNATGTEVLSLSRRIIDSVNAKFGVALTPEVNIL